MIEPITTQRLVIREFVPTDFVAVHAYASDPEVTKYMLWGPNTEKETRKALDGFIAEQDNLNRVDFDLALTLKKTGELIGGVSFRIRDEYVLLGYILNKQFWGNGYATEAGKALMRYVAEHYPNKEIRGTCDISNAGSHKVLEKIGLKLKGKTKELVKGEMTERFVFELN